MKSKWSVALALAVSAAAAAPLGAQIEPDRLRLYGYLTQGFGIADGLAVHDVPTRLTTDLRTLALQVRYAVGETNEVVVQFEHQRLGISPVQSVEDDIELQWAYYQHRAGDFRLRVGRTPVPFGLYNETRTVGTLLPFYRVPHHLYPDGTEAADGAVVEYRIGDTFGWSAQVEAFAGITGYRGAFYTPDPALPVIVVDLRTKQSVGAQLWVGMPIPGLRAGVGVLDFEFREEDIGGIDAGGTVWMISVDGSFDRWIARSEVSFFEIPWYSTVTTMGQLGGWATPALGLFGQVEIMDLSLPDGSGDMRLSEDYGVALNVRFGPQLMVKLEGHQVYGYAFEQWVDPAGPEQESTYAVLSLSVGF